MRSPTSPSDPILDEVLAAAVKAAESAAVPIMAGFRSSQPLWTKNEAGEHLEVGAGQGAANPVTEADLRADALLRRELLALLPEAGWLSEETPDSPERLGRELVWIVDPIDGTREYSQGEPEFAVSIALVLGGEAVLGVLLNPATGELFTARAGGGVYRNGTRCPRSLQETMERGVLLASRTESRRGEFEPFRDAMQVREMGSTAYKLGLVAVGEADAYFTRKPRNEWDVAAGVLLCREAGMTVTDLGGDRHLFNRPSSLCRGVVVGAPEVHRRIMALIRQVGTLE